MTQEELKNNALKILEESHVGTLATVKDNKPHSRYMTFFNDEFTLYTATSKQTQKVEELEANPHAHILLGYEGQGVGDAFLEIEGEMGIHDEQSMIDKVWNDALKGWFTGPDDPNLVILAIKPSRVRLINKKGEEPQTIELQ
ncbi:pyridoxamine 5'-phosphate oxidase family protein [Planomicrobium sp. CPCC 101110]|uniref:pyridoxamine 5'-phosphate oxidase family protein n=1 Tax=Planomicrobium sp. CPCC 101110 TaxID=2599619 RepID=UPI0011B6FEC8|nr:pyridoxamine 5'-phosphate oxidase family protein [Planomicrobium sp. CPCC 101110]TWT27522.1 general stress protein [Planomicrobium sp. CPCC 101110]